MRTRETYDGLPADTPITRADVAAIAHVQEATVQAWTQDPKLGFPEGFRRGRRQMVWHRIGDVVDWLCVTGRADCGLDTGMVDLRGVASHYGVVDATVKQWRSHGDFPLPDLVLARSPYWKHTTLDRWVPPSKRPDAYALRRHTTKPHHLTPREFDPVAAGVADRWQQQAGVAR